MNHQRAGLVTGQHYKVTFVIAYNRSHAVSIRIRSDQKVSVKLFAKLDRKRERFALLRVRRLHGRKFRVRQFLLRHHANFGKANLLQNTAHR
ncbi:hypothetical protein D3C73_1340520 [compost metagenome]